jgi:general secretion pathway protein G
MVAKFFRMRVHSNIRNNQGFTLIEILVVLTILGLMAALVVPNVIQKLKGSKEKLALTQISALEEAVEMYYLDMGQYPPSLSALIQKGSPPWDGPYIKDKGKGLPKDPWGGENQYEITDGGNSFRITSPNLRDRTE